MTERESIRYINAYIAVNKELDEKEKEAFSIAISALQKQEADRWIPVTERLPEEDKCYNVTVKSEGIPPYVNECCWNGDNKVFERWDDYSDDLIQVSNVVAWCPLLKPYTEEDNE